MPIPLIALLAPAIVSGVSAFFGHRGNSKKLQAEERAEQNALKFEREEAARKEREMAQERAFRDRAYNETLALERKRWDDYNRIMQPHWNVAAGAMGGLQDMMGGFGGGNFGGGGGGGMPPPAAPGGLAGLAGGGSASLSATAGAPRPQSARFSDPLPAAGGDPLAQVQSLMELAKLGDRP